MEHRSLSADLQDILSVAEERDIQLGETMDKLEDKGFGLLLALLSLPSALPVPAPGYSTPFGIALVILGIQMIAGRSVPVMPARVRKMSIPQGFARNMAAATESLFRRLETFIKPRQRWVTSPLGHRLLGFLVVFMGALMILPIPFTNTFPAMVIFAIGICLTEEDGYAGIVAAVVGGLSVLLYIGIIVATFVYGPEVFEAAKDTVKDWLGMGAEAAESR